MGRKIRKIKKESLEELIDKLDELPAKEPSAYSAKQVVARAAQKLTDLLKKGYGYDDLVQLLGQSGVKIKRNTLQQYLRESKKSEASEWSEADASDTSASEEEPATESKTQPNKLSAKKTRLSEPSRSSSEFLEMDEDL